jgi:hypothetical protein
MREVELSVFDAEERRDPAVTRVHLKEAPDLLQ